MSASPRDCTTFLVRQFAVGFSAPGNGSNNAWPSSSAIEEEHRRLEHRLQQLLAERQRLKGIHVVSTSLVWSDGYPLSGSSPLSRWFDDDQDRKALWLVSAGNTRGQAWTGTFNDSDGNGVMEFAPRGAKLPAGAWSAETSFLAWQSFDSGDTSDLPEGTKVRITAQWSEPHDPVYYWQAKGGDPYLQPLADLSFVVLRQRDPSGKLLPLDDFEVVARSPVKAFRIDNRPGGSTYEQIVEFTTPKAGRYALRVQRQLPTRWELQKDEATGSIRLVEVRGLASNGIRPVDAPSLPVLEGNGSCDRGCS